MKLTGPVSESAGELAKSAIPVRHERPFEWSDPLKFDQAVWDFHALRAGNSLYLARPKSQTIVPFLTGFGLFYPGPRLRFVDESPGIDHL